MHLTVEGGGLKGINTRNYNFLHRGLGVRVYSLHFICIYFGWDEVVDSLDLPCISPIREVNTC